MHLPPAALPLTMAVDNSTMLVAIAALMACPLRLVRAFTGEARRPFGSGSPRVDGSRPRGSTRSESRSDGGASPALPGGRGLEAIASVQAALERQVAVPARMSGRPIGRDGALLLTEEPAADSVWAAYQRSRARPVYDAPASSGTASSSGVAALGGAGAGAAVATAAAPLQLPPGLEGVGSASGSFDGWDVGRSSAVGGASGSPWAGNGRGASSGNGADSPGAAAFGGGGPRARDGSPLLTEEPGPLSLEAAWARSRSRDGWDSGDDAAAPGGGGLEDPAPGAVPPALTARAAVASLAATGAVLWVARVVVDALAVPHLHLLAVSVLALAASAAGSLSGLGLFTGGAGTGYDWGVLVVQGPVRFDGAAAPSHELCAASDSRALHLPMYTQATVLTHPATPHTRPPLRAAGASAIGSPLMGLFFAAVGATSAASPAALASAAPMAAFIAVMAAVHWAVMLGAARALGLEPSVVLVASNALVGGPATAASERRWACGVGGQLWGGHVGREV